MGGLAGGGGGKSKSVSYNKAYGFDINNLGPLVGMGGAANAMAGDILGLSNPGYWSDYGGDSNGGGSNGPFQFSIGGSGPFNPFGSSSSGNSGGWVGGSGPAGSGNSLGALQRYFDSSGGKFQLGQGLDDLTSKFSALGLSRSGPAMKALEGFRHDLVSTKLDNYLGQLGALTQQGLGGAGLITSAGQYSKSKSSGGGGGLGGILGGVGGLLSGIGAISDRRLKTKIELLRRAADGLGLYRFAYKWAPNDMIEGVMADEVKELRPQAFIPNFRGEYDGVNYALVGAV